MRKNKKNPSSLKNCQCGGKVVYQELHKLAVCTKCGDIQNSSNETLLKL